MFNKEVLDSLINSHNCVSCPVKDFVGKFDFYAELLETLNYMRRNEILNTIKFPSNAECVIQIMRFGLKISIDSAYLIMHDHSFVFDTGKGPGFGTSNSFQSMGCELSDPTITKLMNEFDRVANNLYEQIQKLKAK